MLRSKGEQFSAAAKARVRKGTLLDGEFLRRLLDCSQVSDIARMLKSTYYGNFLPADAEALHRDEFEFLLLNVVNNEVQSFLSSVGLARRAFLKLWLERQDIQLIRNRIRGIYAGNDMNAESEMDLSSLSLSLVDKQKLFSSSRIDEVIASINNKRLVEYVEDSMKRSVGGTSPSFMMGFALDAFQNNRVYDAVQSFTGEEKELLLSIVGTYTDVLNITFIYRGKKYFNMPGEFTLSILYSRYRANFELLKTIASLPPERMWESLTGTRYASLLPIEGVNDGLSEAEGITRNMRSIQRTNALRVFQSGSAGVHSVLAYITLRELEILDLSAIIEIVRYNYDRKKAEKLIAYPLAGGW